MKIGKVQLTYKFWFNEHEERSYIENSEFGYSIASSMSEEDALNNLRFIIESNSRTIMKRPFFDFPVEKRMLAAGCLEFGFDLTKA